MEPFPPSEPEEQPESPEPTPQTEPLGPGGGAGGKPPRPTAVGTGDNEDDDAWEKKIADFRRYDLDKLESALLSPNDLVSWPVPGLAFARIDGILRSRDIELEKQQQQQQAQRSQDPNQLPKRTYLMEDALIGLSSQNANLCFCVLGGRTGVNYYMGMSLPGITDTGEGDTESADISYETLQSILHSVYYGVDIYKKPFTSDSLRSMISPLSNYVGIVTGIPALKSTGGIDVGAEQIERLANGLQGLDFGIMVLAVPIPNNFVSREEFAVLDQIQRAQENRDPKKKRRIKYYLELQDAYLKHIQLGTTIGSWQVGMYFFAPDRSAFVRLQSLIRATYVDEASRPTPLRTHELQGLQHHLEQFGLLRNTRSEQNIQSLLSYRFLTPLNSRMLSAYVHLPKALV